ncbi:diaminopimelate epimerase [Myroides sp. LJL119]
MLEFYKYQATGNDFVMIDNTNGEFDKQNSSFIEQLCDRRFGIGADGLICLEKDLDHNSDFKMVYFNADGKQSSMCGNGARATVAFAKDLGIIKDSCVFWAYDGKHSAYIDQQGIHLKMGDVDFIDIQKKSCFLDTGSPHHVEMVRDLSHYNVYSKGQSIRNNAIYKPKGGTNVNFVEQEGPNLFYIRTYERGVEDETLSCGTGATAVALCMFALKKADTSPIHIGVLGGDLKVSFAYENQKFTNIYLTGDAVFVFKGYYNK